MEFNTWNLFKLCNNVKTSFIYCALSLVRCKSLKSLLFIKNHDYLKIVKSKINLMKCILILGLYIKI